MVLNNETFDNNERRFNGSNDTIFKRLFKDKEILCGYLKYFTGFNVKPEEVFETIVSENFPNEHQTPNKGFKMLRK